MQPISIYALGHYDIADSYGLIACQLARHLSRLGVYVNALGLGDTVMDSQPDDIRAITSQPIRAAMGGIFLGYPTGFYRHPNPLAHMGPRIGITMFESSKIPRDWVAPLNKLDAVIVPCTFCASIFREAGVKVPIHVVPLGIGDVYQYAERPKDRPLTFLTFGDRGARKGGVTALKAFVMAFGESMDYKLIFKMRAPKEGQAFTMLNPNIEVIQRDMSEEELYQLYLSADVLVNPNKGEGFGLLPREFAATGGLSLSTDWGGTADDIDDWGLPLPYTLVPAEWKVQHFAGQDLGDWAEVDPTAVANKLQMVAANRDYYRNWGETRANRARALYNWQSFAERVLEIYQEVADGNRHGRVHGSYQMVSVAT